MGSCGPGRHERCVMLAFFLHMRPMWRLAGKMTEKGLADLFPIEAWPSANAVRKLATKCVLECAGWGRPVLLLCILSG
jgi:hypothetical protein